MDRKTAAKLTFSAVLVAALAYLADFGAIYSRLVDVDPVLYAAAAAVFFTTYASISYRWRLLSRNIGHGLSLGESFRIVAVSYGFNVLFPGNAGDLARSKIFERYTDVAGDHASILGITAMERYLDVVCATSIVAVSLFFIASGLASRIYWVMVPFLTLIGVFSVLLFLEEGRLDWVVDLAPGRLQSGLRGFFEGFRSLSPAGLARNLSISYSIWIAEVAVFYLLAASLGLDISIWVAAFVTSVMSLVSALPISPAGIGPVDAAGTGLLVLSGVGYGAALSLVVLLRSITVVMVAVAGLAVYWLEEYTGF